MYLDSLSFVTVLSNCTELSKLSNCTELSKASKSSLTLLYSNLTALVHNDQYCLQWRTCQTKSDVSALLLLLSYTALQHQPPAIEAMQSCTKSRKSEIVICKYRKRILNLKQNPYEKNRNFCRESLQGSCGLFGCLRKTG